MIERVKGRVLFFDASRGFGIVQHETLVHDTFVHRNVVRSFCDKDVLDEGATVDLERVEVPGKGYRATQIFQVDNSTAHGAKAPRASNREVSEFMRAVVKFYNYDKGFGFVTLASGEDVFVHADMLKVSGVYLAEGEAVAVQHSKGAKGLFAVAVRHL